MKEIQITIEKDQYGSMFANADGITLFQFSKKENNQWYFWLNDPFNPEILAGDRFPIAFFNNACKATFFILAGVKEIPESVKIVKGKKLLSAPLESAPVIDCTSIDIVNL